MANAVKNSFMVPGPRTRTNAPYTSVADLSTLAPGDRVRAFVGGWFVSGRIVEVLRDPKGRAGIGKVVYAVHPDACNVPRAPGDVLVPAAKLVSWERRAA